MGALAGALVVAAVGTGTVAVAGGPGVVRQENGVVAINGDALQVWYDGQVLSQDRLKSLNEDGKAMYAVSSIELACHGVWGYFDSAAEEQAYSRGYAERVAGVAGVAAKRKALAPGTDPADADPCAWWKDPIPGMPGMP